MRYYNWTVRNNLAYIHPSQHTIVKLFIGGYMIAYFLLTE